MKSPDDARNLIKRKFISKHREWLEASADAEPGQASAWPMEIKLDTPTEREALQQPDAVRAWIAAWGSWQAGYAAQDLGSLVWSERRWRSLGTQAVPEKLLLHSPQAVAAWIGEAVNWPRALTRFQNLIQRWPALIEMLPRHYRVLAGYDDTDFLRLTEVLAWLHANPHSGLYPRQIPVNGIDSKWLETRKGLVTELAAAVHQSTESDFYAVCGLRPQPQLIRMRILDPALRKNFSGLGDISAPMDEIAQLAIKPEHVFIVENLQTGLAFEDLTGSVVLMGLGYGVDVLGRIPWLHQAQCHYWGDIDTHGFAILSRARKYLPALESVLMDEATLISYQEFWVTEKEQYASAELPLLTSAEQALFQLLKRNLWGQQIRLEQERICWDWAWNAISQLTE